MGWLRWYYRCECLDLDHSRRCSVDEEGGDSDNQEDDEDREDEEIKNRENIANEVTAGDNENTITVQVTDYETGLEQLQVSQL
jgi:hypothetical protein